MKIFLAGIMQGSHVGTQMHAQDYREELKSLLREHLAGAEIYDPLADHANSVDYEDEQGQSVFLDHNRMCGEVDAVIAFVPQASMGTAIEMWEAFRHGKAVITISPLAHNWAVRFLSDLVYPDMEGFTHGLKTGQVNAAIIAKIS